jgi:hypothetical protein
VVGEHENEHQKLVDALLRGLHNLVSLLLTQQRKTGGTGGWLESVARRSSDAIFNNLQPISVGA